MPRTGSRATHEVQWSLNSISTIESSSSTEPEVIGRQKLRQYYKVNLMLNIEWSVASTKDALYCSNRPTRRNEIPAQRTKKSKVYEDALISRGVIDINNSDILKYNRNHTLPTEMLHGWAKYPGNIGSRLSLEVMQKLNELFIRGKEQKKRKVSADRALQIVVDEVIFNDWDQRLKVTVPKIKAFFFIIPSKADKGARRSNRPHTNSNCSKRIRQVR